MTYHRVCYLINTTGATSAAGTGYPSGASVFTPGFLRGSYNSILVLSVMFSRSLFVSFLFAIALSDYPIGVLILFLSHDVVSSTPRHERKSTIML